VTVGGVSPVVELHDVDTIYEGERIPAIRGINLTVEADEFVCIVGPNGAGKTTLLETINGLLPATRGTIRVLGKPLNGNGHKLRAQIGYLPQNFSVDPSTPFLARQVVLMGRYGRIGLLNPPGPEDHQAAIEAMQLLGIKDLADRPVGKLSGGQLQKVLLARALAKEPHLLLLDEPFNSLDPRSRMAVLQILQQLHEEQGLPILLVTHGFLPVLEVCDRVIGLRDGRITLDLFHPGGQQRELLRQQNLIS